MLVFSISQLQIRGLFTYAIQLPEKVFKFYRSIGNIYLQTLMKAGAYKVSSKNIDEHTFVLLCWTQIIHFGLEIDTKCSTRLLQKVSQTVMHLPNS